MKSYKIIKAVSLLAICAGFTQASLAAGIDGYYHLEHQLPLASSKISWDYISFDQARQYAFVNRRPDGVTVIDVKTQKPVIMKIKDTKNAGDTALAIPEGLGFTSNTDGSTTIFNLKDFTTVKRVQLSKGFDGTVYDPVNHRVAFQATDEGKVIIVDAKDGKVLGKVSVDGIGHSLERPTADNKGNILFAMRDKAKVVTLDMKTMKVVSEWSTKTCTAPNAIAVDSVNNRIFVACRGEKPVMSVLDGKDGHEIVSLPIGSGNDEIIFNPKTKLIYTSNGVEGNLVIFKQLSADKYEMNQAVQTRPGARTMALDEKTNKVYLIAADGVQDPTHKVNRGPSYFYPNVFIPNTFVFLTYGVK